MTGAGLLDIARQTMEEQVLPVLQGDARFRALMIASAMRMAQRDIELAPACDTAAFELLSVASLCLGETLPSNRALCAAIRDRRVSGDEALHRALFKLAVIETSITKPSALLEGEKQLSDASDVPDRGGRSTRDGSP